MKNESQHGTAAISGSIYISRQTSSIRPLWRIFLPSGRSMAFRRGARAYIPLLKSCKAAVWTSSVSKAPRTDTFVGERLFELPELKLLVDAVESSRFITAKKSERLIEKLGKLTSESHARQLDRHIYMDGTAKPENEVHLLQRG